jgi:phosphate transport system substrate-binding protein
MKVNNRYYQLFKLTCFLTAVSLVSCTSGSSDKKNTNDWNRGSITMAADENLQSITEQMTEVYEAQFDETNINLNLQPQDKIINDFINGTVKSMIVSRTLTDDEKATARQNQNSEITETVFAYNAIAVVTCRDSKDTLFELNAIKEYLQPNADSKLVFDNQRSGIAKFIMQKATVDAALFKNALVVTNALEVIEYVCSNKDAIGFIPFNFFSDEDDPQTRHILSKIRVLPVRHDAAVSTISQESIYNFSYPLQQTISVVLGNNPELVGRGFANFLCRDKAAKILLKAGLVPRFMPVRKINILDELKTN